MLQLTIAEAASPDAALSSFLQQQGLTVNQTARQELNGLDAAWADFSASPSSSQPVRGYVLYVAKEGIVYQILGFALATRWGSYGPELAESIMSFQPLRNDRYRDVSPHRINLVRLPSAMTAREFLARYPSSVDDEAVLLANQVSADERLEPGRLMKQVTGGRIPTR